MRALLLSKGDDGQGDFSAEVTEIAEDDLPVGEVLVAVESVSYTHMTLPTNREV